MNDLKERIARLSPARRALLVDWLGLTMEVPEPLAARSIAIIGIGLRLPGASTVDAYHENLRHGANLIGPCPGGRVRGGERLRGGGYLDAVDLFEPGFFQIRDEEARVMDPQQRLTLEVAWEAVERAGYSPEALAARRVGVWIGASTHDYARVGAQAGHAVDERMLPGLATSLISNRVSYVLGLSGPSLTVDAACASSLAAVHHAVQSLRAGECDMAIAGGVNVKLDGLVELMFERAGALSPDDRCRSFDERARGYVRSEGAAALLLRPLRDALAGGDPIEAVILGSAMGHDGHNKAGLTAPGLAGQREVARRALREAGVEAGSVGYMEAHGTASPLGDAIELDALSEAYGGGAPLHGTCALGTVKSRIGHCEAASGVASIIAAALSLRHGELFPLLSLDEPNRLVKFEETPFYPCDRLRPFPASALPRRAAVHSYGIGGVDAHLILQQPPAAERVEEAEAPDGAGLLFTISARTETALAVLARALRRHIGSGSEISFGDLCFTLNAGRRHHPVRLAIRARGTEELVRALDAFLRGEPDPAITLGNGTPVSEPTRAALLAQVDALSDGAQALLRRWCRGRFVERVVVPRLRPAANGSGEGLAPDGGALLEAVARLYAAGARVDWEAMHAGARRRRIPLPTYPFERARFRGDEGAPGGPDRKAGGPAETAGLPPPEIARSSSPPPLAVPAPPARPDPASLPAVPAPPPLPAARPAAPTGEAGGRIEDLLLRLAAEASPRPLEPDPDAHFLELGLDSVALLRMAFLVERALGISIPPTTFFSHPTIHALSQYLGERVTAVPALDAAGIAALSALPPPAAAGSPYEPFETTALQKAYLGARALRGELGGRSCQVHLELEVDEPLDEARLVAAASALLERHPMLRAVFLPDGRQRVSPPGPPPFVIEHLDGRSPAEQEARCAALREELMERNRDPLRGPLCEIHAVTLGPGRNRFYVGVDLLVCDFQSLTIALNDLRLLYQEPASVPPPAPVEFRALAPALSASRHSAAWSADRDFWRERLDDFPLPPALPLAADPHGMTCPRFGSLAQLVEPETWRKLRERAAAERVTLSALVGTVYCDVLAGWSGQSRFCLNLPTVDRPPLHPAIDRVVGPFGGNVIVPVDRSGAGGFFDRVRRFQAACLEVLSHRLYGGVELARALASRRRSGLAPIAPVVYTAALHGHGDATPLWGRVVAAFSQTPQVWLDCQVFEESAGLRVRWDYVEPLFAPEDIAARFAGFVASLRSVARGEAGAATQPAPAAQPAPAPRPMPAPPATVASAWPVEAGPGETLDGMFLAQAARTPRARAVVAGGTALTYAALEERARRIAGVLLARGIRPGELVATLLDRGCDQAATLLGIHLAGAAYTPIDPSYPAQRVGAILADSRAGLVVTDRRNADRLDGLDASRRLVVDQPEMLAAPPAVLAASARSPASLAYVIFTSGSTGRPKGVMIAHRSAANTIRDINRRFSVGRYDRLLGFSSLGFDLSVYDVFGALAAGATLVVLPEQDLKEPARWLQLVDREGVTVWSSVPTALKMLLDFCEGRDERTAPTLRLALLSGDWIPVTLPDRVRRFFEGVEVVSLGGATEASIWSCIYRIGAVDPAWRSIPYGQALDAQRFYILDAALGPVAPGEVGELFIGGAGVALGYHDAPDLTAASFVPHPVTGERIYRTGDLGRLLPDGNMELLGRKDHQVKVRGFRVELAEIEAALLAHQAVDACAVIAVGERQGDKELVAFHVPRQPIDAGELRRHLRAALPEYMVPQKILAIDALPLNQNGKIHREALHERLL